MILVDTSIWIEHLRRSNEALVALLSEGRVAIHPFILGEVAMSGASRVVIEHLRELPETIIASDDEVLSFIERHKLVGHRIGYLDAHLLASAKVSGDIDVWTLDKSMRAVAAELGIAAKPFN